MFLPEVSVDAGFGPAKHLVEKVAVHDATPEPPQCCILRLLVPHHHLIATPEDLTTINVYSQHLKTDAPVVEMEDRT